MKAVLQLSHSDEVSGTTVFSDGAKAHWTEGPSSQVLIQLPDGGTTEENTDTPEEKMVPAARPYMVEMERSLEEGDYYGREMTKGEEMDWEWALNNL